MLVGRSTLCLWERKEHRTLERRNSALWDEGTWHWNGGAPHNNVLVRLLFSFCPITSLSLLQNALIYLWLLSMIHLAFCFCLSSCSEPSCHVGTTCWQRSGLVGFRCGLRGGRRPQDPWCSNDQVCARIPLSISNLIAFENTFALSLNVLLCVLPAGSKAGKEDAYAAKEEHHTLIT